MTAIEKLFAECVAEEEHPTPPVLKMNGAKKTGRLPSLLVQGPPLLLAGVHDRRQPLHRVDGRRRRGQRPSGFLELTYAAN